MSRIPDKILMSPRHVAMQIENAYREGVADRRMNEEEADETWPNSIAAHFAKHYQGLGEEECPVVAPSLDWIADVDAGAFVAITDRKTYVVKFAFTGRVWLYEGRPFEHVNMAMGAAEAEHRLEQLNGE